DGSSAHPQTIGPGDHIRYGSLYQSPSISDGTHTIALNATILKSFGDPMTMDYMVVSPGNQTSLVGKTLMVDDIYSGIHFGSGWVSDSGVFAIGTDDYYISTPFHNTSHTTSTPGSVFSFSYTGRLNLAVRSQDNCIPRSSMTLYGVFRWDQLGQFDLVTTIDHRSPVTKTFNSRTDMKIRDDTIRQPDFVLFTTPSDLEAGIHTISFNLSKCDNQTLIVGYITYTPSFSSLSTMPDLTGLVNPLVSSPNTPSSMAPFFSTPTPPVTRKSHIAALAGGIVAGLVLLSVLALLLIW
ncbi:hypothetical protein C8J56DRAFT_1100754, partial [Mycena floridula]